MGRGQSDEKPALPVTRLHEDGDFDLIRIVSGKNRSALIWAEKAHRGQQREEDIPYILHPVTVATLLAGAGADRNVVCAGVLHDVVEDTDVTLDQIRGEFGDEVARLVDAVTKTDEIKALPPHEQPDDVAQAVKAAGPDACAVKAADLCANLTDLVLGAEQEGYDYWVKVFGESGRAMGKINSYTSLAEHLLKELDQYPRLRQALNARVEEMRDLCESK